MQPNDFPLPTVPTSAPPFSLPATLARLATVLTDDEIGAIAPLVEAHKRVPEGLLRYEGALWVRYFSSFWCVSDGRLEVCRGMFPNEALFEGVEKLEIPE